MTAAPPAPAPLVLLATAAEIPDLDAEGQLLIATLAARGAVARPAVWSDPGVDWAAADLVVVRSTWDYPRRAAEFVAWADRVAASTTLLNDVDLLRWTLDKTYLRDLEAKGIPIVPSRFLVPGEDTTHGFEDVDHVVKPSVSAGSLDTTRVAAGDRTRSAACVEAIHASGRTALVQPYLHTVDDHGETALIFIERRFSHAMRKAALLPEHHEEVEGLFKVEEMSVREPSAAEREVGEAALAVVPGTPLYARVDLLHLGSDDREPVLLELELAEPSLFLDYVPGTADRFADAILARIGRG